VSQKVRNQEEAAQDADAPAGISLSLLAAAPSRQSRPGLLIAGLQQTLAGRSSAPLGKVRTMCIEEDEGWGMIPGPEFGCVHGEPK
jgi:hypothetical protein